MITRRLFILGVVGVGLGGCGGSEKGDGTPKISYGKETCERCGMLITEARHTAAIIQPNGDELHFDDTGEMVATIQEMGIDERTIWVHEYDTEKWIHAESALYVIDAKRRTPMATGIVAFSSEEAAIAFAGDPETPVISWSSLLTSWSIE